MAVNFTVIVQFRQNTVRQLFAQLNAPLIECEDIQDGALSEDFVLIQRNQRAETKRRDFAQQDRVGWAIAFKHFERHNVFQGFWIFTLIDKLLFHHFA